MVTSAQECSPYVYRLSTHDIPCSRETGSIIAVITEAHHFTLLRANSMQLISLHPISLRTNLILSYLSTMF